jgi:Ricin-type beta-trefoil lectin domain
MRSMSKRRSLFALVTAALAVLTIALTYAPAQAIAGVPLNVWNSSHCLDNATENFAKLQMWSCSGNPQQQWLEGYNTQTGDFTFTNANTGRCITAPASGAGTVVMAFCDAAATNQQWRVYFADNPLGPPSGWYDVWQNVSSGLCLSTNSVGNGTLPNMNNCDPSDLYDRWALN